MQSYDNIITQASKQQQNENVLMHKGAKGRQQRAVKGAEVQELV